MVEAIGAYSNLGYALEKWHDLRERIKASPPRPPLLYQNGSKTRSKSFLGLADLIDIRDRYQLGMTTQQIGTHYGISKTRVASVLREQGVTIRRQGLTTEQVTEAATLYRKGKSLAWLGAKYGVSNTAITTALRRQGVQLRARPGWS
ncbi:MAG: hypothetical protein JWO07_115 [Candidatus Saccharibacteria bacterium]|nr:hypothetical protein [Candidatus Saccharibacteria bacterium]